jgi:NAD(P)-dependent dehydrogenase (short-subunit alcohol dehydrogenase family)
VTVDLATPEGPGELVERALAELGGIDVLVNNGAITVSPGPVATGVWTDPDGPIGRLAQQNGAEHQAFADQLLSTAGATTGRITTPEEVARLIAFTASPNDITGPSTSSTARRCSDRARPGPRDRRC